MLPYAPAAFSQGRMDFSWEALTATERAQAYADWKAGRGLIGGDPLRRPGSHLLPGWGIDLPFFRTLALADTRNGAALQAFLDSARPLEVEIGFGRGDFLLDRAHRHPERLLVGYETKTKATRLMLDRIERLSAAETLPLAPLWVSDDDARFSLPRVMAAGRVAIFMSSSPTPGGKMNTKSGASFPRRSSICWPLACKQVGCSISKAMCRCTANWCATWSNSIRPFPPTTRPQPSRSAQPHRPIVSSGANDMASPSGPTISRADETDPFSQKTDCRALLAGQTAFSPGGTCPNATIGKLRTRPLLHNLPAGSRSPQRLLPRRQSDRRRLLAGPRLGGNVRLIYADPPYDSKLVWTRKVRLRQPRQRGQDPVVLRQPQYTDSWPEEGAYLQFLYERLPLLRSLLADNGSLWLHCDHRHTHHLRCLLDEIFGPENYLNTITWRSQIARGAKTHAFYFPHSAQTILVYARNRTAPTCWQPLRRQVVLNEAEASSLFLRDAGGFSAPQTRAAIPSKASNGCTPKADSTPPTAVPPS